MLYKECGSSVKLLEHSYFKNYNVSSRNDLQLRQIYLLNRTFISLQNKMQSSPGLSSWNSPYAAWKWCKTYKATKHQLVTVFLCISSFIWCTMLLDLERLFTNNLQMYKYTDDNVTKKTWTVNASLSLFHSLLLIPHTVQLFLLLTVPLLGLHWSLTLCQSMFFCSLSFLLVRLEREVI